MHPPPEKWTQYGTLSIVARSLIEAGQLPVEVCGTSISDARSGYAECRRWLAGAGASRLATVFGSIDLVTAHEKERPEDRTARITVMAQRLSGYPEDLVMAEIRAYRGVYFPKLDEIRIPLEKSAAYRRRLLMLRAFDEAIKRIARGGPNPAAKTISAEDRARVSAGMARLRRELGGAA